MKGVRSDLGTLMAVSLCVIVGVELYAIFQPDRRFALWVSGGAGAAVLLTALRRGPVAVGGSGEHRANRWS
jgi:hypothetical protein